MLVCIACDSRIAAVERRLSGSKKRYLLFTVRGAFAAASSLLIPRPETTPRRFHTHIKDSRTCFAPCTEILSHDLNLYLSPTAFFFLWKKLLANFFFLFFSFFSTENLIFPSGIQSPSFLFQFVMLLVFKRGRILNRFRAAKRRVFTPVEARSMFPVLELLSVQLLKGTSRLIRLDSRGVVAS